MPFSLHRHGGGATSELGKGLLVRLARVHRARAGLTTQIACAYKRPSAQPRPVMAPSNANAENAE